jgi:hypothetical protein
MQSTRHHFTLQYANLPEEVGGGGAVSTMSFVMSVIRNKYRFELQRSDECTVGRPISMSATMKEQATIYCTMFSLQICFLLCEKSMR